MSPRSKNIKNLLNSTNYILEASTPKMTPKTPNMRRAASQRQTKAKQKKATKKPKPAPHKLKCRCQCTKRLAQGKYGGLHYISMGGRRVYCGRKLGVAGPRCVKHCTP